MFCVCYKDWYLREVVLEGSRPVGLESPRGWEHGGQAHLVASQPSPGTTVESLGNAKRSSLFMFSLTSSGLLHLGLESILLRSECTSLFLVCVERSHINVKSVGRPSQSGSRNVHMRKHHLQMGAAGSQEQNPKV